MRRNLKKIAYVLVFALFIVGGIPAESLAYAAGIKDLKEFGVMSTRDGDAARVQRVLESGLVSAKLQSYGYTKDEVTARLDKLTDAELHQFAAQIDGVAPGGEILTTIAFVGIVIIFLLLILHISKKQVILK